MADPCDKISSQLLEAAMKAEFTELEQREPIKIIAATPHTIASARHKNTVEGATAAATRNTTPPPQPAVEDGYATQQLHYSIQNNKERNLSNDTTNDHLSKAPPPQRTRRVSGTRNTDTPKSGRSNGTRPGGDLQTRAEATKEKNRRAQQRFRHKQKDRLQYLEGEVVRLRNLLSEKGIDPGEPIEGRWKIYCGSVLVILGFFPRRNSIYSIKKQKK